jgi:hypothetical protein
VIVVIAVIINYSVECRKAASALIISQFAAKRIGRAAAFSSEYYYFIWGELNKTGGP